MHKLSALTLNACFAILSIGEALPPPQVSRKLAPVRPDVCSKFVIPKEKLIKSEAKKSLAPFKFPSGKPNWGEFGFNDQIYITDTDDFSFAVDRINSSSTMWENDYGVYVKTQVKYNAKLGMMTYTTVQYFSDGSARTAIFNVMLEKYGRVYKCIFLASNRR